MNETLTTDQLRRIENKTRDTINGLMRKAAVSEENKPIIFAGSLLALSNPEFLRKYNTYTLALLGETAYNAVENHLTTSNLINSPARLHKFLHPLQALKTHTQLHAYSNTEKTQTYYSEILDVIVSSKILESSNPDLIADFYTEFLKYSGGDGKGLGIVLTPHHITNLFAFLGQVDETTVFMDTCFGTGSFVSAALNHVLTTTPEPEHETILQNNVVGIELNPKMFTLGATNLLLRKVNIEHLHEGSCFNPDIVEQIQSSTNRPSLALINPPYSLKKNGGKAEIEFIENACEIITPDGYVFALVPTSTGADTSKFAKEVKQRILEKHSLYAVMSLPVDLFAGKAGTITQILVFKTGTPHTGDTKTWVANWTDDGFFVKKHVGRDDYNHTWESYKTKWVTTYLKREEIPGYSRLVNIDENDEWVTEAYLSTDHTKIQQSDFESKLLGYAQYELKRTAPKTLTTMNTDTWVSFSLKDLFTIERGNYKRSAEKRLQGDMPLVSASQFNNGVTDYVKVNKSDGTIFDAGTLTVSKNGSVGECFYQPEQYVATPDMGVLVPKTRYSKAVLLFIATVISYQTTSRFNYGFKLNTQRLNSLQIPLPATDSGAINVEMIEMIMSEIDWGKVL